MTSLRAHNKLVAYRTGRTSRQLAPVLRAVGKVRATAHKANLLTLLSAVDSAPTSELAYAIELSAVYVATLLDELECEGRVESTRVGRGAKAWSLP